MISGWSLVDSKTKTELMKVLERVKAKEQVLAGISAPMNYFDPLGFTTPTTAGKLLFYREVELKHGRVAMLAALGILVGEQYHPLFGGDIDVPSYVAFQQTPLETFWPAVVTAIAIPEIFSVLKFQDPTPAYGQKPAEMWTMKTSEVPGDLGFDPLGLKPKDAKELKEMQTKELNNGRLAMIAAAGMIAQEVATGSKLAAFGVMGKDAAKNAAATFDGVAYAKELPGVTEPLGFWDPLGFCSDEKLTEGKLKFYREVELKHGRLGMLAALGIVVGENFHPLFGGDIDAPAYLAFQQTPLETFWPIVVIAIAIPEIYSVFTFETVGANDSRGKPTPQGQTWAIRADHESGNLGFDPLNLKPTDPAELKEMQTKELNNGRLAMIAAAGMVVQELVTQDKLALFAVMGKGAQKA